MVVGKGWGGDFKEMVCSVKSEKLWRVIKPRRRSARPANQKKHARNSTALFLPKPHTSSCAPRKPGVCGGHGKLIKFGLREGQKTHLQGKREAGTASRRSR